MSDKPNYEIVKELCELLENEFMNREPNNIHLKDSYVSGYLQGLLASVMIVSPDAKTVVLAAIKQRNKKEISDAS